MTALRGPLRKRQSHLWARHPDDFYVEPEWVSARLFEEEKFEGRVRDPACGMGRIVMSASTAGYKTLASDGEPQIRWLRRAADQPSLTEARQ